MLPARVAKQKAHYLYVGAKTTCRGLLTDYCWAGRAFTERRNSFTTLPLAAMGMTSLRLPACFSLGITAGDDLFCCTQPRVLILGKIRQRDRMETMTSPSPTNPHAIFQFLFKFSPIVFAGRKLAVVDHVQLPKIHRYHEVDRAQRYLESKGNIQKMSGHTRDANELMATSKVARRMLKNPTRTAAAGGVRSSRLDPRALVGPLPSRHQRIPWKPEVVVSGIQTVLFDCALGIDVYSKSL
jgi:hypothetical protein